MSYTRCDFPFAKRRQLKLGTIQPQGWLKELLERNKAGMGGEMPDIEPELIAKAYTTREHKSHFPADWTSEISGTYWCGLIQLAFTLNDSELIERASKWVHSMLKLQEEDGFLGAHRKTDNRMEDYCSWGNNWAYRALLCYYDATGEKGVLKAVHKALKWFVRNWTGDQKTSYAGPIIADSMLTVYTLTGDKSLLAWTEEYRKWLDDHDKFYHGSKNIRRPRFRFREDHVVAYGEMWKTPAMLYAVTGNDDDLACSEAGFRQIHAHGWQVTGAPSSSSEHFSPASCILDTEYCNFATYLNSFSWMGKITGDSRWFDRMEKILFNGAMGARMKNEKAIAYMSCPNECSAALTDDCVNSSVTPGRRMYAPNYHVACCPMQSIRIFPEYVRNAFNMDTDGAFCAAAFGPMSVIPEDGVKITEDTEYPFEETIRFRFQCNAPWQHAFKIRKPEWCRNFSVKRNGSPAAAVEKEDGWLELAGPWTEDVVEVFFKMETRLSPITDVWFPVEPLRVYTYGPLLFCREFPTEIQPVTKPPELFPAANITEKYPWYNVVVADKVRENTQWYAVPCSAVDGDGIRVIRKSEYGYVWEDSPIKLRVPLIRATGSWDMASTMLGMPFGNPVQPDADTFVEMIDLVPYGCTLLRQSCFPVTE